MQLFSDAFWGVCYRGEEPEVTALHESELFSPVVGDWLF